MITNDNVPVRFDSLRVEAYLSGAWTDITDDILVGTLKIRSGINGGQDTDLIADPSQMEFTLNNSSGKYYVQGATPLSGWGNDVKIRCFVVYETVEITQFVGWVRVTKPEAQLHRNGDTVRVTCYGWFEQAARAPILSPSIQRNKTAAQAAQAVIDLCPVAPEAVDLETGSTFLSVFDTVQGKTTAYAELAKIVQSEFGHLYERRDGTIALERSGKRDSSETVKSILKSIDESPLVINSAGDYIITSADEYIAVAELDTLGAIDTYTKIDLEQERYYLNRLQVNAEPRRVDASPAVIASTAAPVFVAAGASKKVTITYIDQSGRAQRVAAVTDEMQTPVPGSTIDPTLMTLVPFNLNATDLTGRHTWTLGEAGMIESDVYADGYGIVRVSGSAPVGGGYCVYGGYSDYKTTTPTSSDFDFGSGAWTIGWWEARIDIGSSAAEAAVARRGDVSYPAFLLGKLVPSTMQMQVFLSSNGTSWDIANGKHLGYIGASRWRYYEVACDGAGWYYAFADGELTDKWYSSISMPSSGAGDLSLGYAQSAYAYTAIADFFIHKGKILHTANFEPPKTRKTIYLAEDYWGNTAQDRSGTDITSSISILANYGTRDVTFTITNSSASNGYVYIQQRGTGVYFDGTQEASVEYAAGIAADGYRDATVTQKYQHDTASGLAKITGILANRQAKRTDLVSIQFSANKSRMYMLAALYCDVGDLLQVEFDRAGVSGYFYIQARELEFTGINTLNCKWTFTQDFEHGT